MPTWCCLVRPPCAHTLPPGCRRKSPPGLPAGWRSRLLSTSTPLDLGLTVNIPAGVDQQAGTWRARPLQRPPQMFLGQLLASLNSVLRKSKAQKSKRELTYLCFLILFPILSYSILFSSVIFCSTLWASQVAVVVKDLPTNAGDLGSTPESGRSSEEGNSNRLQYSCLENSRVRGDWRATVHGIPKIQTWLSANTHTHSIIFHSILICGALLRI